MMTHDLGQCTYSKLGSISIEWQALVQDRNGDGFFGWGKTRHEAKRDALKRAKRWMLQVQGIELSLAA
jgi:hypothetical protein